MTAEAAELTGLPADTGPEPAGADTARPAEAAGADTAEVTAEAAELTGLPADTGPEPAGADAARPAEAAGADTAEVTAEAAEVTAEAGVDGGVVAAVACRENTSKRTRIPAATIATCTARQAMRRKISCGMSNSAPPGET